MLNAHNWRYYHQVRSALATLQDGRIMAMPRCQHTATAHDILTHTWTSDEDSALVPPADHFPGILRRHAGMLSKRDVRKLLLAPTNDLVVALTS